MPTSIQNLYSQSQSLRAYTQALQVTGQNIASNADPAYARQQVTLQASEVAGVDNLIGSSVDASIKDTRDQLLESQIWREQSDLNEQSEHLSYLEQLELTLFSGNESTLDLGADGGDYLADGLITYISDFFTGWGNLEASPNDASAKSALFNQAQAMVDRFNHDAESLADLRSTIEGEVQGSVDSINTLLGEVANLQAKIANLPTDQNSSAKAELIASRNEKLSELSEYISFTWTDNASAPLESTLTMRLADGSTADLLTGSQVNDTLSWDGTNITLTNAGDSLAADRGRVGAQLELLNDDLAALENHWDLMAGEMVRIVNSVYNAAGDAGANFFVPEGTTAASISLEVAESADVIAGTNANGNDIAATLATLFSGDLSADYGSPIQGSFSESLLEQQNRLATEISREQDAYSAQEKVVNFLEQERSSRSGVDLDSEVTNLLQFQRGFQATSRVLRALDESLQTFLSDIS